jgi:hypothetical protein
MSTSRNRTSALTLATIACLALTSLAAARPAAAVDAMAGQGAQRASAGPRPLDLGPADLPETRTTRVLQPGVTLTEITRGASDPALVWTLTVLVPATSSSPDPSAPPRMIADKDSAQAMAGHLRQQGYAARVERVVQPETDVPAGTLGYRVRVGAFGTQQEATTTQRRLAADGDQAGVSYTGWDPDPRARGPWHVKVLTVDPHRFRGRLDASYGHDIQDRETTSSMAREAGATAATNGGFFVLDPAAGAPGDPAGVGVYDGRLLSEPVGHRPALVLHPSARRTSIVRPGWTSQAEIDGHWVPLDGVDREPGLIRNCGGDRTDSPTSLPLQDVTCSDDSELVAITPQYGPSTPTGPGREVVLDRRHDVVRTAASRGTSLAPGETALQGTGSFSDTLAHLAFGDHVPLRTRLTGTPATGPTTMVNGGPVLVRHGRMDVTQRRDGFVHPGDPGFAYGWVVERNPRTFAGIDSRGRTVIVTVDGRSTSDLGLSVPEEARVARSLGLVDAMNLDGGGSTAMAVDGRLVNHPSDATGERAVGEALLVLPHR